MITALTAEGLLLRKRLAPFVVGGTWVIMVVGFGFLVPYIVYATMNPGKQADRAQLLAMLLPAAASTTAAGTYPLFGGAIMLILGVLVTGSEYRWGTWAARLVQGPSRTQVVLAKFGAGAVTAAVIATAALAASIVTSVVIALTEQRPITWAAISAVASLGVAAFISIAWMSVGAALGVVFRGVGTALGVGLLWTLGLENAVAGLAGAVPAMEPVRVTLLGPASGSLVAALGEPSVSKGGAIGVGAYMSAATACAVLLGYVAMSIAVATVVTRHRDIT